MRQRFWLLAGLSVLFVLSSAGLIVRLAAVAGAGQPVFMLVVCLLGVLSAGAGLVVLAADRFRQRRNNAGTGGPPAVDWREILAATPVALALFDDERRLVSCNDPWRRLFADADTPTGALAGEHRFADGTSISFGQTTLADGCAVVSAVDMTDEHQRADEMRADREKMRLMLSAAGAWTWETDVLHRFASVVPVREGLGPDDLSWMIGRDLVELAASRQGASDVALSSCMQEMRQHRRLVDVRLNLQDGMRVRAVRLNGVPRSGSRNSFLGYCGIGVFEAAPAQAAAEPEPPVPVQTIGSSETATRRILLVDDSRTNRALGLSILKKMGYECDAAENGQQAVEAVRGGDYDLVLMDIWMPSMDGFEATAAIRKLPEPAGSIPIVAMTAHAGSKDRQRCLESGMDDHVAKPVDRRVLSAVLQRLLGPATGGAAVGASEPAASAVAALVDGAVLDQLRSDAGPSLVSELLAAFMAETEERVLRMPPALKAGDLDSVAADAHAMKSSCGTFGAVRLQKLVERIESAAARNDVGLASELLDGLPDLVAQSWGEFARAGYPPLSS